MALLEATLTYRPDGLGPGVPVVIGATADPAIVRKLADRLLETATDETRLWDGIDAGVAALKAAEAERLARILALFLPPEPPASVSGARVVKLERRAPKES